MEITLFVYKDGIVWALMEVLGVTHLTHAVHTTDYRRIEGTMELCTSGTMELCTSGTTSKDARDLAMCRRDVRDGFAREIVLNAEPIRKDWKDWGINSTVINFDYSLLNDPLPQE